MVIAVLLAGTIFAVTTLGRGNRAPSNSGSGIIATETAVRNQAVSWITAQVGHDIVLACDAVLCADLAQHGFPAGNLNVLEATAPDPYGSELLIASADVRSQFGAKIGFYAPTVVASFGAGAGHIDVRVIAADGAKYGTALRLDLQARESSGAQLAGNPAIAVTPAARAELLSGAVDTRLLTALAFLAGQEPVSIVAFGGFAPGAAPGVPQRWAYLAESDPAAHKSGADYVRSLMAFAHDLRPPYVPLSLATVQLPGGRNVLRIEFAAPSPLGLLRS
jgi:hypothetical protein